MFATARSLRDVCDRRRSMCRPSMCQLSTALVATLLVLGLSSPAQAGGQTVQRQVKANKQLRTLGYTVDVDNRWSEQGGYRPVRITIAPSEPLDVERQFTVVLRFTTQRAYRDAGGSMTVEKRVVIPAVEDLKTAPPPTEATISVPQTDVWESLSVEFWENGTHRPELDSNQAIGNSGWWGGPRLWDAPLAVRVDSQISGSPSFPQQNRGVGRGSSSWSNGSQTFTGFNLKLVTVPPKDLPEEWIDLTSVDVVVLSANELDRLTGLNQEKWQALRRWVAAGGNLWITGVAKSKEQRDDKIGAVVRTSDWSALPDVDRLLAAREPAASAAPWKNEDIGKSRPLGLGQILVVAEGGRENVPGPVQFNAQDINLWLSAAAGAGAPGGPSTMGPATAKTASTMTAFDTNRLSWDSRMGFDDPGSDFWNFIIPGVGRVPLYTFLGLMTGFVVFIGPLNYIYLRRRGKLHLMLVTVPLCAAVVTAGLYSYALISDGLGTRVRVRSYTEIDQRRGEAVCWSRLCYYAGLAPSQGLIFAGDVAVLPLPTNGDGRRESEVRQVDWTKDGRQHLRSGWLRSRTLTQYFTVRSRHSEARLEFTSTDAGRLSVVNQLGSSVEHLLVCDADGKLHYAEGLKQDAEVELQPLEDASSAALAISQAYGDHRLQRADPLSGGPSPNQPRMATKVAPPQAYGGPAVGRMEAGLAAALQQVLDGKLDPRSYVAIVERSPEVELGLTSADEEAGFHVIVGRW